MCGIVGYIGKQQATPILLEGLKRLEYRGYDSAGIALTGEESLTIIRAPGNIRALEERVKSLPLSGTIGIAHTRWATHGMPTEANAHPHRDCGGLLAVVHNGIIENYAELRTILENKGHQFLSATDTEVLPHLIEEHLKTTHNLLAAVCAALREVRGTYGIAVLSQEFPDTIITARLGSPIVLGIGEHEAFIASDASAILGHTRQMVFLEDGEIAVVRADGYSVQTLDNQSIQKEIQQIDWTQEDIQKNGQPHFMLKEMLEQPDVVLNSIRGRLHIDDGRAILGGLRDVSDRLRAIDRIVIVACGSAYYAGLVGKYMFEEYAGIVTEVEVGSEFRYRHPLLSPHTAVLAISQSGETADTLAALREAKMKGALTLGIVNTVGSTIARETDAGVYNHAGPELGVASTKAFVSQLTVLALFTLFLGRQRNLSASTGAQIAAELLRLPEHIRTVLAQQERIREIAKYLEPAKGMLYLGRKYHMPIAYEGALKLKEVSYIHAEGYAAGEMKHGPIALIDPSFPSVVICPKDTVYEKTKSNMEELRARGGPIVAITTEGNDELNKFTEHVIHIPETHEMLSPILSVIPLQLLAYHVAVAKGFDPDRPRNLAKSVTVE